MIAKADILILLLRTSHRFSLSTAIKPFVWGTTIDIKKVHKQFTRVMHVKDRYVNGTFIDKLTKWHQ